MNFIRLSSDANWKEYFDQVDNIIMFLHEHDLNVIDVDFSIGSQGELYIHIEDDNLALLFKLIFAT